MNNEGICCLYSKYFCAWAEEQARFIQEKAFEKLDLLHLKEELHLMGASERRELNHRLEILLMHLLKWKYQASRHCKSWADDQNSKIRSARSLRAKSEFEG